MLRYPLRSPTLSFLILLAAAPAAVTQSPSQATAPATPRRLECLDSLVVHTNGSCRGEVAAADSIQRFVLRFRVVRGTEPDTFRTLVRFRANAGVILPDSARPDADGMVSARWSRPKGEGPVDVAIEMRTGTDLQHRFVELVPRTMPLVTYGLQEAYGFRGTWFEKSTLRRPIDVQIVRVLPSGSTEAVTEQESCEAQRVAFTRLANAGFVVPDTATARVLQIVQNEEDRRLGRVRYGCFAQTRWTLGDGAGTRSLRASIVAGPGARARSALDVPATARSLPRVIAGLGYVYRDSYVRRAPGTDTVITVERQRDDGTTISFDSIASGRASRDSVGGQWEGTAIFGLSAAIIPRLHKLSVSLGVSVSQPRSDWFAGVSLLRPISLGTESLPVDVHLLGHWGQREVLLDPDECEGGGMCTETETGFQGLGFMVTFDAGSLLSDVIKKLAS